MDFFLRLGAYVLHPLLMPLIGTLVYFLVSPRYIDTTLLRANVIAVSIITFGIPIIIYFLLKNIGWITSSHLEHVNERKIPLMLQSILLLLIIKMVFNSYQTIELYYFFIGILFSTIAALILVLFKIKASLHMMGISGLTMFIIAVSIHFQINMLVWISIFILGAGWVASSRLYTKSHTQPELVIGFFVGFLPQLLLLNYWL